MKYFLSIVVISLCAFVAQAQNSSLSGQVTDPTGVVVKGAEVTAMAKNKIEFKSRSDSYGVYTMKLPSGTYRIEFRSPAGKDFVIQEYIIEADINAMLDVEIPSGDGTLAQTTHVATEPVILPLEIKPIEISTEITHRTFNEQPVKPSPVRPKHSKPKKTSRP